MALETILHWIGVSIIVVFLTEHSAHLRIWANTIFLLVLPSLQRG